MFDNFLNWFRFCIPLPLNALNALQSTWRTRRIAWSHSPTSTCQPGWPLHRKSAETLVSPWSLSRRAKGSTPCQPNKLGFKHTTQLFSIHFIWETINPVYEICCQFSSLYERNVTLVGPPFPQRSLLMADDRKLAEMELGLGHLWPVSIVQHDIKLEWFKAFARQLEGSLL